MIKSMTGFGRGEHTDDSRGIVVEIRSVNHRYSDIGIRMPRRYSFAEEPIKALVKNVAPRGKVDIGVTVETFGEAEAGIRLNLPVARQYRDNLTRLKSELNVPGEIDLELLSRMPDVLRAVPEVENEEAVLKSLSAAVALAVERLDAMKVREGQNLAQDMLERAGKLFSLAEAVEAQAPQVALAFEARIRERMTELLGNEAAFSPDRILQEVALFADKSNVDEELVRLKSHIRQFYHIVETAREPAGKKLDFLVQEMNREVNTIGSKANNLQITNQVLSMKSEIEKIREQVQNIE